jgi:serine/threonine protein kinase
MSATKSLGQLSAGEWQQFQDLADRYHEAWQQGEPADLGAFLPPPGDPLRTLVLQELVVIDLEMQWRRGRNPELEQYLKRYPELGGTDSLPVGLIFNEYHARHRVGDRPPLDAYRQRFPGQFEELRRLVEGGPAARSTPAVGASPTTPDVPEVPDANLLAVVGGYRLHDRIGSAAFGEVWRGEAPGGVPVAVKILFRPVDAEEAQRELSALELIRGLRHRCLVQLHGFWSLQERLYIVMELADGSLRQRLEECRRAGQRGIPEGELLLYFRDAAEGLDFLHSRHVQHRDIKPENILLVQGHAKLADFGLAREQGSRLLSTATGAGTPLYMAPEVFQGKLSPHSDQYSLAMTYAELRLGRRLRAGASIMEIMFEQMERPPDLSPLSEEEQGVIVKALSKDPEQRYPSCTALVKALEQVVLGAPPPPEPAAPRDPAEQTTTRTVREVSPAKGAGPNGSRTAVLGKSSRRRRPAEPAAAPPTEPPSTEPLPAAAPPPRRRRRRPVAGLVLLVLALGGPLVALLLTYEWPRLFPRGRDPQTVVAAPPNTGNDNNPHPPPPEPPPKPPTPTEKPPPPAPTEPAFLELKPPAALVLGTGEVKPVPIHLERRNLRDPIKLTFAKLPAGVTIADVPPLAPDAEGAELRVTAAADAAPGTSQATVWAASGDQKVKATLDLTVVFLPPKYKPAGPELVTDQGGEGKQYYQRIRREFPGGLAVEFVLVPKGRKDDPASCYMMVDKASVGLFRKFIDKTKAKVHPDWTDKAEDGTPVGDEYPVFNVHVDDAHGFAEWLGGRLPAPAEWDKAAGLHDRDGRDGPFRRPAGGGKKPEVAVGRTSALKVGEAPDDVSVFGCRDMAGNGWEWTGSAGPGDRHVPLAHPTAANFVRLRGHSFQADEPLLFRDMAAAGQTVFPHCPYNQPLPDLGFRVVLETR